MNKFLTLNDDEKMLFSSVTLLDEIYGDEAEEAALLRRITKEIEAISLQNIAIPQEMISQLTMGISSSQLSDQFAQYFPMQVERKQELLETLSVNDRLLRILEDISREQTINAIENDINEKVKGSVDENQREFYLVDIKYK